MTEHNKHPAGMTEESIREIIEYHESMTGEQRIAHDEAAFEDPRNVVISVPHQLVPQVRRLLAREHQRKDREEDLEASGFPPGWDEERVYRLLGDQTENEELEEPTDHAIMIIPRELEPTVRGILNRAGPKEETDPKRTQG